MRFMRLCRSHGLSRFQAIKAIGLESYFWGVFLQGVSARGFMLRSATRAKLLDFFSQQTQQKYHCRDRDDRRAEGEVEIDRADGDGRIEAVDRESDQN